MLPEPDVEVVLVRSQARILLLVKQPLRNCIRIGAENRDVIQQQLRRRLLFGHFQVSLRVENTKPAAPAEDQLSFVIVYGFLMDVSSFIFGKDVVANVCSGLRIEAVNRLAASDPELTLQLERLYISRTTSNETYPKQASPDLVKP